MVTLQKKKLKDNKVSLYLDIYSNGKRQYKFLKMYLYLKPNAQQKAHNNEVQRIAEEIRAQTELDILKNIYKPAFKGSTIPFLTYFKEVTEQKRKSLGNYGNWDSVHKILEKFFDGKVKYVSEITDDDLINIRSYILNEYRTKSEVKLSQNAASSYFNKVKACLNQAFDEKLITDKIGGRVKAIKPEATRREYLTKEEIDKLIDEDCRIPILKNAFLFSVFTGLRWSDINNLKWGNVETIDNTYTLKYKQQKTGTIDTLPIPDIAIQFMGEKKEPNERVFKGLKYSAWHNLRLTQWMMNAGINRKITFHSARHSYATQLFNMGADVYTVMELLGHKHVKTTQVYTRVMGKNKVAAIKLFDKREDVGEK